MPASLRSQDVARLVSEPSAATRTEIAGKVAAELAGAGLTETEIAVAKDTVRMLARDIEATVRASVAEGLRHSRNLPHDVALKLAEDIDQIAMPLLTDSLG